MVMECVEEAAVAKEQGRAGRSREEILTCELFLCVSPHLFKDYYMKRNALG